MPENRRRYRLNPKHKTVIFEEKYGVNIDNFSTTEDIDEVIEKKIGRKMKVVKIDGRGVV